MLKPTALLLVLAALPVAAQQQIAPPPKPGITVSGSPEGLVQSGLSFPVLIERVNEDRGKRTRPDGIFATVDTGSETSLIPHDVVALLDLRPLPGVSREITGINGKPGISLGYAVRLTFPNRQEMVLTMFEAALPSRIALLGRDALAQATVIYDGVGGSATLQFHSDQRSQP